MKSSRRHQSIIKKIKIIVLNSPVWLIVGFIIFIFISSSLLKSTLQKRKIQLQIDKLKNQEAKLTAHNEFLVNSLDYFASKSRKERDLRLKLNLQKPDERIIIISREKDKSKKEISTSSNNKLKIFSNLKKWWEYFFKK